MNGSHVPAATGRNTAGNHRASKSGMKTRHMRCTTHTAISACTATTGHKVTVPCSGSMNSE
jgi:hypothetical protein